jgi:hypothetical protein
MFLIFKCLKLDYIYVFSQLYEFSPKIYVHNFWGFYKITWISTVHTEYLKEVLKAFKKVY